MTDLIPAGALDSHVAVLGKTGAGKSNLTKVMVEKLIRAGERVCIIDPKDDWWGLRLDRNGKKPSDIKPIIFGGNHADLPLGEQHGAVIAEAVASSSDSVILVTRLLTAGQRTRFFTAFAEALLRVNNGPLHLIIDEAHIFAPEAGKMDLDGAKMLGAANNLVSLGRGYGLRIWLLSQRPQKLAKDALTQAETLVAMRLIHNLDVKAVRVWIGEWATGETGDEIVRSLPSLPNGDAWVWSPQLDYLKRVHAPLCSTYDSGKPPSRDEAAPTLSSLDTTVLGDKMDAIRQEAQANDPKRLKAEIARLEREKAQQKPAEVDDKVINTAWTEGYTQGVDEGFKSGMDAGISTERIRLGHIVLDFAAEFALATGEAHELPVAAPRPNGSAVPLAPRQSVTKVAPAPVVRKAAPPASDAAMGAERRPLAALVSIYPSGLTEAQWASISGFKRTGGTWGTYKSRLRTAGRIEERGDLWFATAQGVADIGDDIPQMPDPGPALVEFWCGKLGAESKFLQKLAQVYPNSMTRDELADFFDMTPSGGTFGTYLSRLRSNGLIEDNKTSLRAAAALMERA